MICFLIGLVSGLISIIAITIVFEIIASNREVPEISGPNDIVLSEMKLSPEFGGMNLDVIWYHGRPCCLAGDISAALQYANKRTIANKVRGDWANEFVDGDDFTVLAGNKLRKFEKIMGPVNDSSTGRASRLMLVFKSGFNKIRLLTRQPLGKKLRWTLAGDVMPPLAHDGQYIPGRKNGITAEGTVLELDSWSARPIVKELGWSSPFQIADRLGISVQRVGCLITLLCIRGDFEGLSRAVVNKAQDHGRQIMSYEYSPRAEAMIEEEARRQKSPDTMAIPVDIKTAKKGEIYNS